MENTKTISQIEYSNFEKLELKTAKITNAEDIEGADKLYKLTLDDGSPGPRTICAGIKEHYSKEELIGKTIIIIANLKPRKPKGIESNGMLLAAGSKETNECLYQFLSVP